MLENFHLFDFYCNDRDANTEINHVIIFRKFIFRESVCFVFKTFSGLSLKNCDSYLQFLQLQKCSMPGDFHGI